MNPYATTDESSHENTQFFKEEYYSKISLKDHKSPKKVKAI